MNQELDQDKIIKIITKEFPSCQAIYIFGSFAIGKENNNSDIDIAVLFSHKEAKENENLTFSNFHRELMHSLNRDVDLINLRTTTTVLQKEVITKGRCIFCSNIYARDEFEMLTLSFYQKLNEERKEILEDFYARRK